MRNETRKRESEIREEEESGNKKSQRDGNENKGGGLLAVERDFKREIEREEGGERIQCEERN